MGKKGKYGLFIFLFLCFAFPAMQQFFHIFKEKPLEGAYNVPKDSSFTWSSWTSGKFQEAFNESTNYRIGFRTDFVRTRNQIDFTLFDKTHVRDVVKGKNGHLFRYTHYYVTGGNWRGEDSLRNDILTLKTIQDSLKVKGKYLLYVIAPEKLYYYEEYLPERTVLNPKSKRQYLTYQKYLKKYGCDYIDLNNWFLQLKPKTRHTLYSKGGVHWTQYGAYLGYDSIVNYLRQKTSFSIPALYLVKLKQEKNPWAPDTDILNACNIFIKPKENLFTYPELRADTALRKTTAVVCADSYFHAITWPGMFEKTFSPQSTFWYYNREINSSDNKSMQKVEMAKTREILETADVYVVMFSVMNLEKFDYGFLKRLKQ